MKAELIGLDSNWLVVKTEHFEIHNFVSCDENVWSEPLIDTYIYTIRPNTMEAYKKEIEFVGEVLFILNERTGEHCEGSKNNEFVKAKIEELLND